MEQVVVELEAMGAQLLQQQQAVFLEVEVEEGEREGPPQVWVPTDK